MLTLKLTGSPVLLDSELQPVRLGKRALLVLAYIVIYARPTVSRQTVAGTIWPSQSDERAKGNLRRELHAIRSAHSVLSTMIVPRRTDIEFHLLDDLHVDLFQLETISRRLVTGSFTDRELVETVDTLCSVDPILLNGFDYEWIEVQHVRFEEDFLRTTDLAIDCLCQKNHLSDALRIVEKQLSINSLKESSYLRRMRLLAYDGNRALAIKTYDECEKHLLQELGVKPNSELRRLHAELLLSVENSSIQRLPEHAAVNDKYLSEQNTALTVGRQQEVSRIRSFLAACQESSFCAVLIRGISGIGKSHLLDTAVGLYEANGYSRLRTQCSEYQTNEPFSILAQLLQQFDQAHVREVLSPAYLNEVLSTIPTIGRSGTTPLSAGQRSRSRFFDAMGQLIQSVGDGVVVSVDDVQWLDADSAAWLAALVRNLSSGTRIVFLFGERVADDCDSEGEKLLKESLNCDRLLQLYLEPLNNTDASSLYREERKFIQQRSEPDKSLKLLTNESLHSLTGGKPQLIVELARYEGAIDHKRVSTESAIAFIAQFAAERMGKLSAETLSTLEVIAVVNGPFQWKMLSSVCEVNDKKVLSILEELWRSQLLKVTQSGDYELIHPFYRDVLLKNMSPPKQTFHHTRIANFYRVEVDNGYTHAAGLVAVHCLAAGDRVSAFSWFKAAAEHAERTMAHKDAIAFCEKAKSLLPELGGAGALVEEEISVLLLQVRQASVLEGYASPTVKALCNQILNRSKSIEGASLNHEVNKQIRILYTFGNKPRKARLAGMRQIEDAVACGDLLKQVEAWRCKGAAEFQIGRFVDCEASMTQAIDLANRGIAEGKIDRDHVPFFVTVACNFRALMQYVQDRPQDGAASLELGQSYHGKQSDIFSRYLLSITQANVYQLLGNTSQVKTLANQLQSLADEYHLPKIQCIADYFSGWVIAREGDAGSGLEQISAAIKNFPKTADHHLFPFWWSYKAELELESNKPDSAYLSVQKALTASRYTRQGVWVAEQYRLLGVVKNALGHDKQACADALSCSLRVAEKQQAALFSKRTNSVQLSVPLAVT